jgi:hypothetical protein
VTVLLAVTAFVIWHLSPLEIFRDTTTVGGDTPAHNYLASHLADQLFHHGRIIAWADGWWGGFPMFQFYFCLPYVLVALLSLVIPFNIAFKLICVLGVVALPSCAYAAARLMRFPRPAPLLLAAAMTLCLFTRVHTMWGVNIASTLAGMISNSLSFALMLPAIASAYRDVEDGRFRLRTVFLLALVMASHFFTSVMAGVVLVAVPVIMALKGGDSRGPLRRLAAGVRLLAMEGGLALLLMAWWLVPLVAKSEYSMEFGVNWVMTLWKNFPGYTAGLIPLALLAVVLGNRRQAYGVWVLVWMLVAGVFLFHFGFGVSPVFVNVRLWPFIFFAIVALGAVGLALLLESFRGRDWVVVAFVGAVLAGVSLEDRIPGKGVSLSRSWSFWNFSGLEIKPSGGVFDELVLPLRGTPGRLANDLCAENDQLGSSRIFELAPHVAGKPILEGGLVNSGAGSMFAYYIQSESSPTCAGYPPIVQPATFNFTNATRHLELFNVKHFIARSEATRTALQADPRWRLLKREEEWELHELMSHDGHYVFIPPFQPVGVETKHWKECALEWLYTLAVIDQPFVFIPPGTDPAGFPAGDRLTEAAFRKRLAGVRAGEPNVTASPGAAVAGGRIWDEEVSDGRIAFKTDAVGAPHIIKCTYFPNWEVRGAKEVFMVSPAFMLVFPEREQVELTYGSTWSDLLGRGLTGVGWCLVGLAGWCRRTKKDRE